MIVGFDLHQDIELRILILILRSRRRWRQSARRKTLDDGRVIVVGRQDSLAITGMGVLDHLEQSGFLLCAIDGPAGVEYFVAAMLRVGLREHHQFNVARVATKLGIGGVEIIDFVCRQGKSQVDIRLLQCDFAIVKRIDFNQWPRLMVLEQGSTIVDTRKNGFDHAIVQQFQRQRIAGINEIDDAAFDPANRIQTTIVCDISRFAGPWRDRTRARHHVELLPLDTARWHRRTVTQQVIQLLERALIEPVVATIDKVNVCTGKPVERDSAAGQLLM